MGRLGPGGGVFLYPVDGNTLVVTRFPDFCAQRSSVQTLSHASLNAAPHTGRTGVHDRAGGAVRRRITCAATAMGRLLCAGRAQCGGVAVGGAAAEDSLAESEAPLAPRVVRLGGRTVRTVRTACQLLLTLARRQLRRSPRSLASSRSPRCRRPTGEPGVL